MTALLPIIEELADAKSDAARADWLRQFPCGVIITYQTQIRMFLQGFRAGNAYFDALLARELSTRTPTGAFTQDVEDALSAALDTMNVAVFAVESEAPQ